MELKRNVVMLPTNKKAVKQGQLVIGAGHYLFASRESDNIGNLDAQELYITSDEEIKKGDWYIDDTNDVRQSVTSDDIYWKSRTDYKKIIATTDKSLKCTIQHDSDGFLNIPIPSPSDSFIKKFIERYNEGYPITDVMVEYEPDYSIHCNISANECLTYQSDIKDCKDCPYCKQKLKVDKNNCITIRPIKETWTREEVIALTRDAFDNSCKYSSHKEWIEQNL